MLVSAPPRSRGSVALDKLRASASLAVFFGHARAIFFADPSQFRSIGPLGLALNLSTRFAHVAVIVFFVVSGYLVGGSTARSWQNGKFSAGDYAFTRLTRLWLVMIPALTIGLVLDAFGASQFGWHPIYQGGGSWSSIILRPVDSALGWRTYLGNLAFLQTILVHPQGSNGPLWSMANEFWYYVLLPLGLLALSRRDRIHHRLFGLAGIAAACAFVGLPVLTRFPIWLCGLGAAHLPYRSIQNASFWRWGIGICLVSFGLGSTFLHRLDYWPVQIGTDYILAAMAAGLIWLLMLDREADTDSKLSRASRALSGMSFSLYLLHTPMLVLLAAALIPEGERWVPTPARIGLWLMLCCGIIFVAWGHSRLFDFTIKAVRERLRSSPFLGARISPRPIDS